MQVIEKINPELISYLDTFKDWVFRPATQTQLRNEIQRKNFELFDEGRAEDATSLEYLGSIEHHAHSGFPPELRGLDLNYETVKKMDHRFSGAFVDEIRAVNFETDGHLQTYLGAKLSALKAFYPEQGYIAWHTNWNAPGYNIIFTYSATGNGYWRHIDPRDARGVQPNAEKLVHVPDTPGWHCKVGYFGSKEETDKLVWHSAYTTEPRVTLAYLVYEESIWKNLVQEIQEQ